MGDLAEVMKDESRGSLSGGEGDYRREMIRQFEYQFRRPNTQSIVDMKEEERKGKKSSTKSTIS